MQKFLLFTSFALLLVASAFTDLKGIDEVISALRTGNVTELGKNMDDNIELAMPDKTDSYSKAQALIILRDFFAGNGVKSFEVKHSGDNGGSQFCIGNLETKNGSYRTTVFMKTKDGRQVIKEIRFQAV